MTAIAEPVDTNVDATTAAGVFDKITAMLQEAGHPNPESWRQDFVTAYGEQVNEETPHVARVAANSYWRFMLGRHSYRTKQDTSDARFCLEDACSEEEWQKLFKQIVAPAIVRLGV